MLACKAEEHATSTLAAMECRIATERAQCLDLVDESQMSNLEL